MAVKIKVIDAIQAQEPLGPGHIGSFYLPFFQTSRKQAFLMFLVVTLEAFWTYQYIECVVIKQVYHPFKTRLQTHVIY